MIGQYRPVNPGLSIVICIVGRHFLLGTISWFRYNLLLYGQNLIAALQNKPFIKKKCLKNCIQILNCQSVSKINQSNPIKSFQIEEKQ